MERVTISLPEELLDRLRRVAAEEGTSMAALVREAVQVALTLDTGPLYGSLDRSDADHAACRALTEA